jgi:hypothetical protein
MEIMNSERIIFANPKLQRFIIAARPRSFRNLLTGIFLYVLALPLLAISIIFPLISLDFLSSFVPLAVSVIAFIGGLRLWRLARRYLLDATGKLS